MRKLHTLRSSPRLEKNLTSSAARKATGRRSGKKIPRFDNRIIDKCRLIPRLNVCKIRPLSEARGEGDLLHYEITLSLKLLNLRFFRNSNVESLSFEEFKAAFEIAKSAKYKMGKAALKKFLKSISASVLSEDQSEIEAPRESGRASFSRPAMLLLKELIFSGMPPAEFYAKKGGGNFKCRLQ